MACRFGSVKEPGMPKLITLINLLPLEKGGRPHSNRGCVVYFLEKGCLGPKFGKFERIENRTLGIINYPTYGGRTLPAGWRTPGSLAGWPAKPAYPAI